MKKIISFLVVALLSITSVLNTNGAGTSRYAKENLIINWTQIASWHNVLVWWWSWNTIYYEIREDINGSLTSKYYKYNNWNINEIKGDEMDYSDLWNESKWTISKHYKLERDEENMITNVYIDWKLDWKFSTDFDDFYEISDNSFYYTNSENWEKNFKVFIFNDDNNTKVENKEIITTENAKLDKTLNKVFEKVDEKWDENAQKIYKTLISKIDILLKNKMSEKNKNTLNYIKEKVEAKIK